MSGYARGQVLEAASGLMMTRAALLLAGFRRWEEIVEWLTPVTAREGTADQLEIEFARAVAQRVSAAARHLPLGTNCLDQSLVLLWMLRRRGIAGKLHIGARNENAGFEAHAWIELGGVVLDTRGGGRDFTKFEPAKVATETRVP